MVLPELVAHRGYALHYPENTLVATPVGAPCGYCGEPIERGEHGCIIPHFGKDGASENPYHFECHMRMIVGSLAHQQKRCTCYGGAESDPPGMMLRQAARVAFEYWSEHKQAGPGQQMTDAPKKNGGSCEICGEPVENIAVLCGCEKCGRLYGPCCNSIKDSICVECI